MLKQLRTWLLTVAACASCAAFADPASYPNGGTEAPVTTFAAASSGVLQLYYTGWTGGYVNLVGVRINGTDSALGLNNHTAKYGDVFVVGPVSQGDVLEFFIDVQDTKTRLYSNPALNTDGKNHAWASAYAGDSWVPAGTHVAFEDLTVGSDYNYHDHGVVFNIAAVPEPASAALMLLGVAGLTGLRRAKRR